MKKEIFIKDFSKKSINKNNYCLIDLVKFIMAIFVVIIHTAPLLSFTNANTFWDLLIDRLTDLAVPFFFMASAFFLFKKMLKVGNGNISSIESLLVLKQYILKMIKFYIIWQVIYLPFIIFRNFDAIRTDTLKFLLNYVIDFFFIGALSWHLWYILASIYISSAILLMLKIGLKAKGVIITNLVIFVLSVLLGYSFHHLSELNGIIFAICNFINKVIGSERILAMFIYFAIALCLQYKEDLLYWAISLLLSVAVFVVAIVLNKEIFTSILFPLSYILFFVFVLNINLKEKAIYKYLRKQSTIIYFVHVLLVWIALFVLKDLKLCNFYAFIISSVLSIGVATIILLIQKKKDFKIFKWLF